MIPCECPHERFFGLHFPRRMCRCIFNHFYVTGPNSPEFGEITQNTRLLRHSRSFKVTDFCTTRKPICDFLLVINSNLPHLLACTVSKLWPIIGQIFASNSECPNLTPSLGWSSANIRINFTSPETRMIVLPDAENRTILSSFVWTKHRNVMDRQTNGQTVSLWLLQRSTLRAMRSFQVQNDLSHLRHSNDSIDSIFKPSVHSDYVARQKSHAVYGRLYAENSVSLYLYLLSPHRQWLVSMHAGVPLF